MRNTGGTCGFGLCALGLFLVLTAPGCGARNDAAPPPPPDPLLPASGSCPGAMPGENIQVTFAVGESNSPDIVWDGEAFVIAWWDMRGRHPSLYHMRMSPEGYEVTPVEKLPGDAAAKHHDMTFDGSATHIVWTEESRVLSTRLSYLNPKIKVLSENGGMPASGRWNAAVWVEAGELLFRSDGMITEETGKNPKPVIIGGGGIQDPQIAYNGVFYGVAWSESSEGGRSIVMRRVSPQGELLGDKIRVSATRGISKKPALVWNNGRFALAWTTVLPNEGGSRDRLGIFFASVLDGGKAPSLTRQLDFRGSADQVALAATGEEYALSWVGTRKSGGSAVYMQRLDLSGAPLESTLEVTDGVPLTCSRPRMAWDGKGYAVVWHDDRDQVESEVFFSYVHCGNAVPAGTGTSEDAPDASVPEDSTPGKTSSFPGAPKLKDIF